MLAAPKYGGGITQRDLHTLENRTASERHDLNVRPPESKSGGLTNCPTLRKADYLPVCERIRVLRRLPGSTYYATSLSSCLALPDLDSNQD